MANLRVSLEPSVLKVGNKKEEDVLIGSRCKECKRYFFPQRKWCGHCAGPTTDVVELSREGTISSFSLMTRKQNYCLVETPYILGEVMIPEGILIYTVINAKSVEALYMGQKAKLNTTEIKTDEKGNSVIAYRFAPVE
jgi:uncharacterized protein